MAKTTYKHLVNLTLAENSSMNENLNIDILIGSDFYWRFFNGIEINVNEGLVAMETCLGSVLSRRVITDYTNNNAVENVFKITTAQIDTAPDLIKENDKSFIESVKNFWKVEDTGIHAEQDSFMKNFKNSIEYKDSRYTIKLPWKGEYKNIPDNFAPARNRLLSLLKRLSKNPEQLKHYDTIFKEQERNGVIEPVDNPEVIRHREVHYIPHKEVVKEERETTKLRIVYNASANQNGPSINESLNYGPSLLPKIFDILVRFRSYKYAIISDIQSAFWNI